MSQAAVEVCHSNIGPRQRARRRNLGYAGWLLGALIGGTLMALGTPVAYRLFAVLPLLVGSYGYFQAREKT